MKPERIKILLAANEKNVVELAEYLARREEEMT